MLIFTKTCRKNRNGATSCFISYLRLLYDQYCQLTCYRLKPLRNSGVVHADGTGTWPAGELVIAVNFMSKFFFVCHVITKYFFAGHVVHQHVSSYGSYQRQGGRWKLLAFQSFVHSSVRFQFCDKSNYTKPLGSVKRPRKKFSLAIGHVNIMFWFIHPFVQCQPKGFRLFPCFRLLLHFSLYSFLYQAIIPRPGCQVACFISEWNLIGGGGGGGGVGCSPVGQANG